MNKHPLSWTLTLQRLEQDDTFSYEQLTIDSEDALEEAFSRLDDTQSHFDLILTLPGRGSAQLLAHGGFSTVRLNRDEDDDSYYWQVDEPCPLADYVFVSGRQRAYVEPDQVLLLEQGRDILRYLFQSELSRDPGRWIVW
jgi:hypothetical protein